MGFTDQLVHQHVARERYEQVVMQLETEVRLQHRSGTRAQVDLCKRAATGLKPVVHG